MANQWMNRWTDRWTDRWTNGWMDGWTDGWMDGWTDMAFYGDAGCFLEYPQESASRSALVTCPMVSEGATSSIIVVILVVTTS